MNAKEKMNNIMNKVIEKIKTKLNLPIILFIIIFINFIPLILPNMFSKEAIAVPVFLMAGGFAIEIGIMFCYFLVEFKKNDKKIEITKEMKKAFILLSIVTIILLIVQVCNFFTSNLSKMDIVNIGCIFANIVFLFILILNKKINEKDIYSFFKAIVYMALASCIVNLLIYYKEILGFIGIGPKYSMVIKIKSFFANRNQFAFFLYVGIIADIILLKNENKIIYKILLPVFFISLIITMSRTGLLVGLILLVMLFFINEKMSLKTKLSISAGLIVLGIIILIIVSNFMPTLWKSINANLVRIHEVKNLSGRTDIWSIGINLLVQKPQNMLFGIGRFNAIKLLEDVDGTRFTQYHNIYLDSLVTGGIITLAYFIFIFYTVIKKVIKSDLDKNIKNVYITMFITYAIYIMFESFGRFSIGCSDTLCLIFFITIPLLHANSVKSKK